MLADEDFTLDGATSNAEPLAGFVSGFASAIDSFRPIGRKLPLEGAPILLPLSRLDLLKLHERGCQQRALQVAQVPLRVQRADVLGVMFC